MVPATTTPKLSFAATALCLAFALTACPKPNPGGPDGGNDDAGVAGGAPQILGVQPTEGPLAGGTTVAITGNYFAEGATVRFGTKDGVMPLVTSQRRISVKTPAGNTAGPVAVTVTNPDGTSATLEDAFTYAGAPPPTISDAVMVGDDVITDESGANPVQVTVKADVEVPNVTSGVGPGAGVTAQVGIAPATPTLSIDDFTWTTATYSGDADGAAQGDKARDEYSGTLSVPGVTTGSKEYAVAIRFTLDGATYAIADLDGSANGTSIAKLQHLVVTTNRIDWCKLGGQQTVPPPSVTLKVGQTGPTVYAQIYEAGVTDKTGAGAAIDAQIGVGDPAADPSTWTWTSAAFNTDTGNGSNDEYQAVLPNPGAGSFAFAYRARIAGGAWRYCDADGSGTGATDFEIAQAGTLTVGVGGVDKCKLQFPSTLETREGVVSSKIYGWVYAAGVTDASGQGANVTAEVGYGPTGTQPSDPSWQWSPATYNVDKDNGQADEYQGTFVGPMAGTYAYAYRFSISGGAKTYCDLDGSDVGGFSPSQAGALTAKAVGVDLCTLDGPATYQVVTGSTPPAITARVLSTTVTDAMGQGTGITGQLGYGPPGTMPGATGWTWVNATYATDADMGQSDQYTASFASIAPGTYRVAYRFKYQTGAYVNCDLDGSANGWTEAQAATISVVPACQLSLVSTPGGTMQLTSINSGDPIEATAHLNIPGVTNQTGAAPNVLAQVGVGTAGTDASAGAGWGWKSATFKMDDGATGDDVWSATVNPAYTGTRSVSFRFSTDNGTTWAYCDRDGNAVGGYQVSQQADLTVNPHADVDYCNLQFPATLTQQTGTTMPTTVYGRAYEAGVTGSSGAGPAPVAELGYGVESQDPGVAWTWVPATFNVFTGTNNNDNEYQASFPASLPAGMSSYAFRFRLSGGTKWCYGDLDGSTNGFSGGSNIGQATVTP